MEPYRPTFADTPPDDLMPSPGDAREKEERINLAPYRAAEIARPGEGEPTQDVVIDEEQWDRAQYTLQTDGSISIRDLAKQGMTPRQAAAFLEHMKMSGNIPREGTLMHKVHHGEARVTNYPYLGARDQHGYDSKYRADLTWVTGVPDLNRPGNWKVRPYFPTYRAMIRKPRGPRPEERGDDVS